MYDGIIDAITKEVSPGLAFEELKSIQDIDRWFTFAAFARSAAHAVSRWKSFGLSGSKVDMYPADGRTPAGSWVLPLAWDATDAVLTIEEPSQLAGTVIARYKETPCSLAMWSAPTPKRGVAADLVWVEDAAAPDALKGLDLKGKIVFTSSRGVFAKGAVARRGAVGLLSDFVTHRLDKPDCAFWTNAWSDDPNAWALLERDSRLFGFNITPRKGDWLRDAMKRCGRIRVRAVVDTRIYKGTIPTATAFIPGTSRREEVLILGHAFEVGANDNASGCAVMLEAARALNKLIGEGALPRPKRSIRFLIVSECYSTFAYSERYAKRMANTVAGVCVDSVGHKQSEWGSGLSVCRPPDANASFVTAFAERLAQRVLDAKPSEYKWTPLPYATTDNVVTDPLIGPPTILLGTDTTGRYWHSTGDTLDRIDVEGLGKVCRYTAAYLYALASAGAVDALYFAALSTARTKSELGRMMTLMVEGCEKRELDFETAAKRLAYVADRGIREVSSVRSLLARGEARSIDMELASMTGEIGAAASRDAEQLEQLYAHCGLPMTAPVTPDDLALRERAEKVVPVRKYIGTMSFDFITPADREGYSDPRWDGDLTAALFWCDGARTLAEVLDLAGNELSRNLFALVPVFDFMAKHALIELRRA